jgi:hypothetical protein
MLPNSASSLGSASRAIRKVLVVLTAPRFAWTSDGRAMDVPWTCVSTPRLWRWGSTRPGVPVHGRGGHADPRLDLVWCRVCTVLGRMVSIGGSWAWCRSVPECALWRIAPVLVRSRPHLAELAAERARPQRLPFRATCRRRTERRHPPIVAEGSAAHPSVKSHHLEHGTDQ